MIEPSATAAPSPAHSHAVVRQKVGDKDAPAEGFAALLAASVASASIPEAEAVPAAERGPAGQLAPAARHPRGKFTGKLVPPDTDARNEKARRQGQGGAAGASKAEEAEGAGTMAGSPDAAVAQPVLTIGALANPPNVPAGGLAPLDPQSPPTAGPHQPAGALARPVPAAERGPELTPVTGSQPAILALSFTRPGLPPETPVPLATLGGADAPAASALLTPTMPAPQIALAAMVEVVPPIAIRPAAPLVTEDQPAKLPLASEATQGSANPGVSNRSPALDQAGANDAQDSPPSHPPPGGEQVRASRASEPARVDLAPAVAGDLRPLMTPGDGPALPPSQANAGTAPSAPAPQDFATLVDRLVAAREAAHPLVVHAALAHAEFGRIELRLAPDSEGLSVALASADPGLAPAVQAAASHATRPGDDKHAPKDHADRPPQSTSASVADDRGAQPQSRGSSPDLPAPPRQPRAPSLAPGITLQIPRSPNQTPERSGGIYA